MPDVRARRLADAGYERARRDRMRLAATVLWLFAGGLALGTVKFEVAVAVMLVGAIVVYGLSSAAGRAAAGRTRGRQEP
ncbi:MAG: hypothetical protein WAP37_02035 [Solirubrobacterales bacterium]